MGVLACFIAHQAMGQAYANKVRWLVQKLNNARSVDQRERRFIAQSTFAAAFPVAANVARTVQQIYSSPPSAAA
jgi:hypothetical protein